MKRLVHAVGHVFAPGFFRDLRGAASAGVLQSGHEGKGRARDAEYW